MTILGWLSESRSDSQEHRSVSEVLRQDSPFIEVECLSADVYSVFSIPYIMEVTIENPKSISQKSMETGCLNRVEVDL